MTSGEFSFININVSYKLAPPTKFSELFLSTISFFRDYTFDYNRTHGRLCENTDFTSQSTFSLKQTTQIEKRSNYNSKGLWVKMSQKICGGEGGNLIRKTLLDTI